MNWLWLAVLLSADQGFKVRTAGVMKISPAGVMTLDNGDKMPLAGVRITNPGAAANFFAKLVEKHPAKIDVEPEAKSGHVYVSAGCADAARVLHEPAPAATGGECVRSIYVNQVLLEKKWAAPAPKGILLHREKLFPDPPPKPKKAPRKR